MNKKKLSLRIIVVLMASISIISGCSKSKNEDGPGSVDSKSKIPTKSVAISDLGYYNIRCRWYPDNNLSHPSYMYFLPTYGGGALDVNAFSGTYYTGNGNSQDYWQWRIYQVTRSSNELLPGTYYAFVNKACPLSGGGGVCLASNSGTYPDNLGYPSQYSTTYPIIGSFFTNGSNIPINDLWIRESVTDGGNTYYRFRNATTNKYLNIEHQLQTGTDGSYGYYTNNNFLMESTNAPSGWWSSQWTLQPAHDLSSHIALKLADNSRFVCAENQGASQLVANRDAAGLWETFDIIYLGNGQVALLSRANNQFVCTDLNNSLGKFGPLYANRSAIGQWETFDLINNSDGSISLRSHANGQYVRANLHTNMDPNGDGPLFADADFIDSQEKFFIYTIQ